MIHRGGAMAQLGRIIQTLDHSKLPVHITPAVELMFEGISKELSFPQNIIMGQLLNPVFTDILLRLLGDKGRLFEPLLHNTVNATIIKGGDKINVIPSEIILELDGRLLPGFTPEDMLSEIRGLLGGETDIEVVRHEVGPAEPEMGLFETLGQALKKLDPDGFPVPLVLMGVTDARHFSKLGIQTYGFTPMKLPVDFNYDRLAHAANERIPIDALEFGSTAMFEAIKMNKG